MMNRQKDSGSSGSDSDPKNANIDERKRKRMISNRESARRSRMRKQQHLDELINHVTQFKTENSLILQKINNVSELYTALDMENNVLRAQMLELTDRLKSLNCVLEIVEEVSGLAMDIPKIPDNMFEPWQLPSPVQPTLDAFQC